VDRLDEPSASFGAATIRNPSATTPMLAQAAEQAEIKKPLISQGLK